MQSINDLGVMNYKGRICDLRKMGYAIETKYISKLNRQGEMKTFALYTLKGVRHEVVGDGNGESK
jgi:hypothetical protein